MLLSETIGAYMRRVRKEKGLPLRKVAAQLDTDPSTLSKIERETRQPTEEMILRFSEGFELDKKELRKQFICERIAHELMAIENSEEVLSLIREKIRFLRQKNSKQGRIDF